MKDVELIRPCPACGGDHFGALEKVTIGGRERSVVSCDARCNQDGCEAAPIWGDGWCFKHHPLNGPVVYDMSVHVQGPGDE